MTFNPFTVGVALLQFFAGVFYLMNREPAKGSMYIFATGLTISTLFMRG